jgi:hypothetical protein
MTNTSDENYCDYDSKAMGNRPLWVLLAVLEFVH